MAATNPSLLQYDGAMGVNSSGARVPVPTASSWAVEEADRLRRHAQSMASHQRLVRLGQIASVAPFAVAGGAALAGGGAAAGGVGAGSVNGLSIAPYAGSAAMHAPSMASSLSSAVPWLRLSEIGVGAGMDLWGQHNANKASDRALQMDMAAQEQYRKQLEQQLALDREKFEADQEQNRLDRVASDDDRAYTRTLSEAHEGRRAPFRTVGRNALFSLADIAKVRY